MVLLWALGLVHRLEATSVQPLVQPLVLWLVRQ
jgi:hypothetical protein